MIAGPELLQDRTHILELLLHHPDVVERDLVLVERDVELGGRHLLDGLMRDATGRATLLFVVGRGEQEEFPMRAVEAVLWVRENVALLRRYLSESGILWEQACRCLIICQDCDATLIRRLETVAGIDLDLMELRTIRIRNQNCWAAVSRLAQDRGIRPAAPASTGGQPAVSSEVRGLWNSLLDRLGRIDRELVLDGDRYSAEVCWRGTRLCRLRLRPATVLAEFPKTDATTEETDGDLLTVQDERSAAQVLDRVLRRFLALQSAARPRLAAGAQVVSHPSGHDQHPAATPPREHRAPDRTDHIEPRFGPDLGRDPGMPSVRNLGTSALS